MEVAQSDTRPASGPTRDPVALMSRFCSLGVNCELGIAQKSVGSNPFDLLRWAMTPEDVLLKLLRGRFTDVTEGAHIHTLRGEYFVRSPKYDHDFHTFIRAEHNDAAEVLARFVARLSAAAAHLVNDLTVGERIFVRVDRHGEKATDLARELSAYGPGTLLVVREDPGRSGCVERVTDKLLIGYHAGLSDPAHVAATTNTASWIELCENVAAVVAA